MLNQRPDTTTQLECLRRAGRIAAAARRAGVARMLPGARLFDVCVAVEDETARLGGAPAFPAQTSVNHVAAHYCPAPGEETRYAEGDLAKLDIGVHVDGWVVDTAVTVEVGRPDGANALVAAARDALTAAIAVAGPGVPVRTLSAAIAARIHSHGFRPMRNLCGHGVGRYTVHCPPPIPNEADESLERLRPGHAYAIEPFATDGPGLVAELGPPEVFRVPPEFQTSHPEFEPVLTAVRRLRGLPFARRQLAFLRPDLVEATLEWLQTQGALAAYPPLVEVTRRPVAQAEHTLYVGDDGAEVLT